MVTESRLGLLRAGTGGVGKIHHKGTQTTLGSDRNTVAAHDRGCSDKTVHVLSKLITQNWWILLYIDYTPIKLI